MRAGYSAVHRRHADSFKTDFVLVSPPKLSNQMKVC